MHRTPYTPHRLPPTLLVWFQAASCALFWRRQPSSISSINWASVSTGSSSFHKHQNLIPSSVKRPTPTTYSLSPLFLALSSILFLTVLNISTLSFRRSDPARSVPVTNVVWKCQKFFCKKWCQIFSNSYVFNEKNVKDLLWTRSSQKMFREPPVVLPELLELN